ncbi:MAG: ornithine aminomutase subunit alpha [Candidatus Muiribacteriaceae bacterium]
MGDFNERRKHLEDMNDTQLKEYFWQLAEKITSPLVDFAAGHTSPSIERSVLMRMGFNSMQSNAIVEKCVESGTLGKGAGHVVIRYAEKHGMDDLLKAGAALIEDRNADIRSLFGGGGE